MRLFISTTLSLCLALFSSSIWADNTREFTLQNGLKLIVKEDHRAPVIISSVWYRIGASNESDGITGISHVLEHMMFRGTPTYGPGELPRIIAENGGQENASTSEDFTNYYQELPANKLAISFQLESDRMQHLSLDAQAFKKEIQVVMEERRLSTDDDPQQKTLELFNAAAHIASPYHHSVIGWMNDLQNLRVEDVKQWYQTWYAPNNASVVVVGDVKPDEVYTLAKQYFGALKPHNLPVIKPQTEIEPLGRRDLQVVVPAKLPWLLLGYNVPSLITTQSSQEAYALEVLAAILSIGDSARLPAKLVRAQQIAASTGADYDLYSRLDSLFTISAVPTQKHTLEQLEKALLTEIKNLQTTLVTSEELTRAKTQLIANKIFQKDSIQSQAMEIGALISVGRSWQDADAFEQHIKAITALEIQSVAKKYLTERRLTVARLQPL